MKGVSLEPGQVVVLSLDGTLVYVEAVQPTFAAVVALPEQPTERSDDRVFTPGRVGAKKISPFSSAERVVPVSDLTERNRNFIGVYEQLREQHGPNHVDRTPAEQAAFEAANAPKPAKSARSRMSPEEREAAKAARKAERAAKKGGPRFLQRCTVCGEQPGHPNHPDQHEFKAPEAPAPTPVLCAACDKPEDDAAHAEGGTHRFIPGKRQRTPKAPIEPKAPRASKPSAKGVDVGLKHRWVGNDVTYELLVSVNPKFGAKNSGGAIVDAVKAAGEAGASVTDVMIVLAQHPRWGGVPADRVQLAFGQMLNAKLIEAC